MIVKIASLLAIFVLVKDSNDFLAYAVIAYVLTSYFMGNEITIEICRKINNYVNFHNKVQLK